MIEVEGRGGEGRIKRKIGKRQGKGREGKAKGKGKEKEREKGEGRSGEQSITV